MKFTPANGQVTLHAVNAGTEMEISITDTGIGVPQEALPRLFDRFYQAGNLLTEKPSGAGLGLAICREILAQHHTELELESAPGKGSRFSFVLPVAS